jgi:hypothetical protein
MGEIGIFFLSLLAFAGAARGLIIAVQENVHIEAMTSGYSRRAVRVGKAYKLTAWSLLTIVLLVVMSASLVEVVQL